MTHVTPLATVSGKNKMKKNEIGPRVETLMLIRQFARVYEYEPERKREKNVLVN